MLRLLSHTPPLVHVLLLAAILLLRAGAFYQDYSLDEESFLLILAQKINLADHLYTDAWSDGPPLMVWLYNLFENIFGQYALPAIRIFACFYVYLSAACFNGLTNLVKPIRQYGSLPGFLFVWLTSVPWFAQEMNTALAILLPATLAFYQILQAGEKQRHGGHNRMFTAGLLVLVCLMIAYKSVFVLTGVMLSYFLLKSAELDEIVAFFGGILSGVLLVGIALFYTGSLSSFWDMAVIFHLDRILLGEPEGLGYDPGFATQAILYTWFPVLLLALSGFVHFRLRYFNYVVKIRSVESLMSSWLVSGLLLLLFKIRRLELSDYLYLAAPVAFYAAKAFDFKVVHRFRLLILIAVLALPLRQYTAGWSLRFPSLPGLAAAPESRLLHGGLPAYYAEREQLHSLLSRIPGEGPIWIMGHHPAWYIAAKRRCATRYTDYRMVYYKVSALPGGQHTSLFSRKETDEEIYASFAAQTPDLIIDTQDNFPYLQSRYPGVLGAYRREDSGSWHVYIRENGTAAR